METIYFASHSSILERKEGLIKHEQFHEITMVYCGYTNLIGPIVIVYQM